ncbi:MAG: T9SS type A sorting domain-containing protein, partial [Bacteroidales bacterium]|nr:T9SS type A sorting domain-containing protein [Bacteroidales bacterium]
SGSTYVSESSQIFCIVGWNHEDMDKFDDDLYLVGVEFMLGVPSTSKALNSLNTIVYVNDQLVYIKPYEERFQSHEWVQAYFDQVFKMKQSSEIAVGYSISYDPTAFGQQEGAFVFDAGPRKAVGKTDLISMDGKEFGTLYAITNGQLAVNLCINALVVRLRDLNEAAMAADPKEYLMSKAMRMDLDVKLAPEKKLTDAPKTSSEGIKLLGFNIYRDNKKLNDSILTGTSYEENVARGNYEYAVGAVYENAEELKASLYVDFTSVDIEDLKQAYGVSVYPNPTSDRLNIKGDYTSFMLVDLNGRVLMRDVRNTESVSLAGLNNGVYFMLITLPNGDKRAVKVIKR